MHICVMSAGIGGKRKRNTSAGCIDKQEVPETGNRNSLRVSFSIGLFQENIKMNCMVGSREKKDRKAN